MEESSALHKLTEAVDLIRMVEDLTAPSAYEKLSPGSMAGIRITLRNIRENILSSHDRLAENLVNRSKASAENKTQLNNGITNKPTTTVITPEVSKVESVNLLDNATQAVRNSSGPTFTRRDLRASLERLADR